MQSVPLMKEWMPTWSDAGCCFVSPRTVSRTERCERCGPGSQVVVALGPQHK